ncbi:UPF0755 protein [Bibersteinia trehalosi USDA-ARS-USMARC-189]|uniref:Endolytic murein transglycosylase n=1 Tax=Bibersteinia trehalosi USDA-ARS-USMARC-189 TaxID=1263831 RepID=A0ABN4C0T8_BIBTR|nr:endolytic transglycosylase MltG [Bibersteinia trehalosi]AGH37550.1 UPF0755 protein [Bibersteinia trehalosi USDA-ARS-USMARC-192]AHG84975.1 UPF0755 protein [Bibersteinia trehalosi USDA-ARS-USMARC-189]
MLKKILIICGVATLMLLGSLGYIWQKLNSIALRPLHINAEQLFVLEKGTNGNKLIEQLVTEGIIAEDEQRFISLLLRVYPEFAKFKAGVYSFENVSNVKDLLQKISSGKEIQLNIQFIEGKTFTVWREQLKQAKYLNQTLADKSETEIAKVLGIPHEKLEGWFAPDTYSYVPYSDDIDVLKRAYQKQQKDLDDAWQKRAENLPLANPYEMLILASIVEKETGIAKERPQVASVFINRLNKKMLLQTDPTILYGKCGCYDQKIYKSDINRPTPYNTYVITGLPPTPIAMPSLASIKAVAQPDNTAYLYFVADGSGGHKFSRTLEEHNRAVIEWRKIEQGRK